MKAKRVLNFVLNYYLWQLVAIIGEALHFGVWRHEVLWFSYPTYEHGLMSAVGVIYLGIYYFAIWTMNKIKGGKNV